MENFKSQLNLDALQRTISNVLTDSMRSQGILLKAETGQQKKKQRNCSSFRNHGQKKSMSFK
jgi:hypothetical protein